MAPSLEEMLDNRTPIADDGQAVIGDADYNVLFKDLQSNILTPHRFQRAHYWFLRFRTPDAQAINAKYLLGMLARNAFERSMVLASLADEASLAVMPPGMQEIVRRSKDIPYAKVGPAQYDAASDLRVVSEYEMYWCRRAEDAARDQAAGGNTPRPAAASVGGGVADRFSVNVLLTPTGYRALGMPVPPDSAFRAGMVQRGGERLNDPEPGSWDGDYAGIHALLIVAYDPSDQAEALAEQQRQVTALRDWVAAFADIRPEETGNVLPVTPPAPALPYRVEPFGFRDDISQPSFFAIEQARREDRARREQRAFSSTLWDPFAPLRLALTPDPGGRTRLACGTYFVVRKLEQDVELFYEQARALALAKGVDEAALRAQFVGRNPDGSPIVESADGENDYDFQADQDGLRCPFYAHVRKTNPRADERASYEPREHRIVRRGIAYGPSIRRDATGAPLDGRVQPLEDGQGNSIGLLFMCAQRSIQDQFEHIQANWSNQRSHPLGRPSGVDTVSGQLEAPAETSRIGIATGSENSGRDQSYRPVVTLKGGEYFFAPSISFLHGLLDDLLTM